jgi:hypothetical protein
MRLRAAGEALVANGDATHAAAGAHRSWTLHTSLWVTQILLAGAFGMSGLMKAAAPMAELATMLPWTAEVPETLVRFIGDAELVAAVGLVLPSISRWYRHLTSVAAGALVVSMVVAVGFRAMRGELGQVGPIDITLAGLAAFVAWGSTKPFPRLRAGRRSLHLAAPGSISSRSLA